MRFIAFVDLEHAPRGGVLMVCDSADPQCALVMDSVGKWKEFRDKMVERERNRGLLQTTMRMAPWIIVDVDTQKVVGVFHG